MSVDEVKEAVKKELDGPGKLLGYRAMHHKVRHDHDLNVPRDLVHAVMYDLDPKGLEARGPVGKKKTKTKGSFTTKGPNWVHSLDGHDKLMGYHNSTFPLAVLAAAILLVETCYGLVSGSLTATLKSSAVRLGIFIQDQNYFFHDKVGQRHVEH